MPPALFIWLLELELCGLTPRKVGRIAEIVDQMVGEIQLTFFEKSLPSDALRPFTQALVFIGALGISLNDLLDRCGRLRPARRLIRNKGDHNL